jgi:hypothetical protein
MPSKVTIDQLGVTLIFFNRLQLIQVLATGSTTILYAWKTDSTTLLECSTCSKQGSTTQTRGAKHQLPASQLLLHCILLHLTATASIKQHAIDNTYTRGLTYHGHHDNNLHHTC